jgi:acetyl-CoA carboxylase carboxyl transferase subunit alpha
VAAEALGITASRLKSLGLIDKVIVEPLGGAHRDQQAMMQSMKRSLQDALAQLKRKPIDTVIDERLQRLLAYGKFSDKN